MDNPEEIVTDPVCGMKRPKKDMKTSVVYQGITYYFCFETDKELFLAQPDYWLRKSTSS